MRYPLKMKWMQIYKRSLYSGKLKLRYGWILAAMSAQNGIRIRNKQRSRNSAENSYSHCFMKNLKQLLVSLWLCANAMMKSRRFSCKIVCYFRCLGRLYSVFSIIHGGELAADRWKRIPFFHQAWLLYQKTSFYLTLKRLLGISNIDSFCLGK